MIFLASVAAILFTATALLVTRRRSGVGFVLCICLYPIFLTAVFAVPGQLPLVTWLALAVINMGVQYGYLRREGVSTGIPSVMLASLVLWPLQYGALLVSEEQRKSTEAASKVQREAIGPLPAQVSGIVSYTQHIATEPAEDMVWLEEYPDLALWVASELFDDLEIAEGGQLTVTVDERQFPGGENRLYIVARGAST